MPYEYHAKVTNVIDGDTIVVDIDLGFNIILSDQSVRLLGVDTPESRTSDKVQKVFGLASKDFTKSFVEKCEKHVIIRTHKTDESEKFGRLLAEIINPTTNDILNNALISESYAVKYLGENKDNVKELHLNNRKRLIDAGKIKMSYKKAGIK